MVVASLSIDRDHRKANLVVYIHGSKKFSGSEQKERDHRLTLRPLLIELFLDQYKYFLLFAVISIILLFSDIQHIALVCTSPRKSRQS